MDRWSDGWKMDDNKLNIYLTMHKAKQENVNKASPAGVGIDMALRS